ncbi:MAG: hypothetical protein EBT07_03760 [Actinobacteria bacterium]|nr:hypothetical protein [Actinomycetota bacterium]
MSASRCSPFWLDQPSILYKEANDFFPFHPRARKCTATALNSLTRFGIYLGVLLAVVYRSGMYLGICLGIAAIALAAYYGMKGKDALREGFDTTIVSPTLFTVPGTASPNLIGGADVADKPIADVIGTVDRTLPTGQNPFMSMLVNEIKDNPMKPPAVDVTTPEMARTMSDEFQTRMYGDPSDVFQHTQNQRTWIVQPSTSIPNDQDSFQNWLFRVPGKTCKEGNNAACFSGTEGGVVTWLGAP